MTWNWDVTATVKPPMDSDLTTKSVNLMCYLLHNITYNQLYKGPLLDVIVRLRLNLRRLPKNLNRGAIRRDFDLLTPLDKALKKIEDILESRAPMYLQTFMQVHFRTTAAMYPDEISIVEILEELHTPLDDEFEVFCTPFLTMQDEANPTSLPDSEDLDDFFEKLGGLTLFDLYTLHEPWVDNGSGVKVPGRLAKAVRRAKDANILQVRPFSIVKGEFTHKTPPAGNSLKCKDGTCSSADPMYWCNSDENGHCTINSD